jgi:hypothetical protein
MQTNKKLQWNKYLSEQRIFMIILLTILYLFVVFVRFISQKHQPEDAPINVGRGNTQLAFVGCVQMVCHENGRHQDFCFPWSRKYFVFKIV